MKLTIALRHLPDHQATNSARSWMPNACNVWRMIFCFGFSGAGIIGWGNNKPGKVGDKVVCFNSLMKAAVRRLLFNAVCAVEGSHLHKAMLAVKESLPGADFVA